MHFCYCTCRISFYSFLFFSDCKWEDWHWLSSNHVSLSPPHCQKTIGNFCSEKGPSRKSPMLVIFLGFVANGKVGMDCHQIIWACQHQLPPFAFWQCLDIHCYDHHPHAITTIITINPKGYNYTNIKMAMSALEKVITVPHPNWLS